MSPITHFFIGWAVAEVAGLDSRRDRAIVAVAGVIPDLDGLGAIFELATRNTDHPMLWFTKYHHLLGHNILAAAVVVIVAALLARRRTATAFLACVTFHLHLLCDLIGGRGPDGYQWPIYYLWPFFKGAGWTWKYQWQLNAWPNFAITILLMAWMLYHGWKKGRTALEVISSRADSILVGTIRARWPVIIDEDQGEMP